MRLEKVDLPRFEGLLQQLLRTAAQGRWFLLTCMALAFAGSISATYPVTVMIVPAALLMPQRWGKIAAVAAMGSALGAVLLMLFVHQLGWIQLYEHFPGLATHATWTPVVDWAQKHGPAALFLIAISPLPQTPALVFFGIASHQYPGVFLAVFSGKLLKYGLLAWLVSRFPARFDSGLAGLFRYPSQEQQTGR